MSVFERILAVYKYLDLMWVFIITNFNWRITPESMHSTVSQFSTIESDTSKQLYQAYQYCNSHQGQKILLNQILDEINHSEIFKQIFVAESLPAFSYSPEQKRLAHSAEELKYLVLYCHVGEAEAAIRFQNILSCFKNHKLKQAIQSVLDDEEGHVITTKKLLRIVDSKYNDDSFNKDCIRIFMNRRLDVIKRLFQNSVLFLIRLLLTMIYYILGVFMFPFCRKRMNQYNDHLHSLEINAL